MQELVNAAVDYDKEEGGGLRDFIDHAALVSDTDQYKRDAPVTLMTMHSAKGLEFPARLHRRHGGRTVPALARGGRPGRDWKRSAASATSPSRAPSRFLYVTHAMQRRVYGEEMASEPSQFLNEMPLDTMEDLSRGASWLSFARSSSRPGSRATRRARCAARRAKPEKRFEGKTYDSVDSIAEFFRQRGDQIRRNADADTRRQPSPAPPQRPTAPQGGGRPSGAGRTSSSSSSSAAGFAPGTHVRHPKYGRGLVLRREGVGDAAKLTVSFPGFGQKKLIEKYAGLEKA